MSKILKVVGASWLQTKISSYILGLLGVLAILALFVGQIERIQEDGTYAATVFYSEKTGYRIEYWGQSNELANIPKGVARAYFRMDIDTIGWSLLEVETDGSYPDEIQAYAAGIVEGALTWYLIHTHLENTIRAKCDNTPLEKQCDKLRDALDKSVNIWKTRAAELGATDPFWHHVSLYYTQISGVFTGWKHGVERSQNEYDTDISDLFWLNSVSEITEIQHKLNITLEGDIVEKLPVMSSAFLRLINETSEHGKEITKLYVAHNAAGNYNAMNRIMKRYILNYHLTSKDSTPALRKSVDFTSYPGSITSQDEFYILRGDRRMTITGTPLKNYNKKLWKDINITDQLPIGPRLTAANHLASNVSYWGHILAKSNSGTACKQWLVVDFNKLDNLQKVHLDQKDSISKIPVTDITENIINNNTRHTIVHHTSRTHARGVVWLIEQVPSRTHSADLSDVILERGHWATYGLPFFKDIAETTNVTEMEEKYGKVFSESNTPRAVIFKKGYKNATSLNTIVKLMRQTAFNVTKGETNSTEPDKTNVIDEIEYWLVLGVRGDILTQRKEAYGVIDTKVASGSIHETTLEFMAISSPPYTEVQKMNRTKTPVNKGNVVSTYTDQFDDEQTIDGLQIRDLVKKFEKTEKENLEKLNKDVKPFQWSNTNFKDAHDGLPDKWAFEPYAPKWAW